MMIRCLCQLLMLVLVGMVGPACGRIGGSGFVPGIVIEPQDYEVSELACTSRVAEAMIEGEIVDEVQWWGTGMVTNRLSEPSPTYDLFYRASFEDGSQTAWISGALIFPLAPGDSQEFAFLVSPVGKTPTGCQVQLQDSVLNYYGD